MTKIDRRQLLKAGVWAAPAILVATAAPSASASETIPPKPPSIICANDDRTILDASFQRNVLIIRTRVESRNAFDVTIRQSGFPQYHQNYVTQGKNPGDNQTLFVPGDTVYIELPRAYDLETDWMQIRTLHNENCIEIKETE
jgi:hypothetical protein